MTGPRMKGQAARRRVRKMRPLDGDRKRSRRSALLTVTRRGQRQLRQQDGKAL
jgi:hypothetical protein